jgi:hypothetical protein
MRRIMLAAMLILGLIFGKLAEDIYRYFGLQPYWPEERRE